jgi:hypothetical protein
MSVGPMRMRLRLGIALTVGLTGPVGADTGLGCPELGDIFKAVTGYSLTLPPAPNVEAMCAADDVVLRAEGWPQITVKRLQLAGTGIDGTPDGLTLDVEGLRVMPELRNRNMDPRLRAALRLQTVDVMLTLRQSTAFDGLELRNGVIALSGGTEVRVEADLKGAGLESGTLLSALLTALDLEWKTDGRLLRPAMEAAGERLTKGATGDAAVDAARQGLLAVIGNLPEDMLTGDTAQDLAALVEALPQGRGRLVLSFDAEAGIGAARLAIAALSDDPTGKAALAKLFAGTVLSVDWQPGIAP